MQPMGFGYVYAAWFSETAEEFEVSYFMTS